MTINRIKIFSVFMLTLFCMGCATNRGSENAVSAVDSGLATVEQTGRQATESGIAATKNISASQMGLTDILVNQLDISPQQALGGAGAIFQAAKASMDPQAFTRLSQSVPGINSLLSAAPEVPSSISNITGGISSVMGDTNNVLGSMTSLASSFEQLNLSPSMVEQFIPIVTNYVRVNGGQAMANLLQSALAVP